MNGPRRRRAISLVEVLVAVAVVAVIAAILFPILSQTNEQARHSTCISNMRKIGVALSMYSRDNNYAYPQCRRTDANPDVDDADGGIENPEFGSAFAKILPYTGHSGNSPKDVRFREGMFACPDDPTPFDSSCPDVVGAGGFHVTSYLINGWFLWGLNESAVAHPSDTIDFAERHSEPHSDSPGAADRPYCGDSYNPWFYIGTNAKTPPGRNDMDEETGAISTHRHQQGSDFIFCDTHVKWRLWPQTFSPGQGIDLHKPH